MRRGGETSPPQDLKASGLRLESDVGCLELAAGTIRNPEHPAPYGSEREQHYSS